MPRTALPKPEQAPADSKPTLDTFTRNIGFTPNMMATFAQSPIAFNSWAALLGCLSKALDVKTRDSIGLAVSEVNGCNYCLTVHSFTAEHMAKLPADGTHPAKAAGNVGQAAWASVLPGFFQFQGSSSSSLEAGWSLMRRSTSA